jgi:2-octaprenyl-6-methoxyphenol hydroxylase
MMTRTEHGIEALGYVARYGDLVAALAGACERAGVAALRPARVASAAEHASGVTLALEDGRTVEAQVAVQAEGGVFGEQAGRARQRDYGQTAVIARVATSHPIPFRAFERFTEAGPLALLPQEGSDGLQYALVWCMQPERAAQVAQLDDAAFLATLGAAFGTRLGSFTATSARAAYPLGLNAEPPAAVRSVAIGNAAQTLHPVAGQGLNLGLRDAAVLARRLARGATPEQLQAFVAERQRDRGSIVTVTDTMARIFANSGPLQPLLGLSLAAIDTVRPARALLAELMMFGRR